MKGKRGKPAHFTSEFQRAARACVRRESLVAAGKKGFAACPPHIQEAIRERFADWRRSNPSTLEKIVAGWLRSLRVRYRREYRPTRDSKLWFDFFLPDAWALVEVDGKGWHSTYAPGAEGRMKRDRSKANLARYHGMGLLRLAESEIRDGTGRARLVKFLEARKRNVI